MCIARTVDEASEALEEGLDLVDDGLDPEGAVDFIPNPSAKKNPILTINSEAPSVARKKEGFGGYPLL